MIIAAVDGRERVGGRKACVIATVGEERRLPARGERRRKAVEGSCRVGAARCREVDGPARGRVVWRIRKCSGLCCYDTRGSDESDGDHHPKIRKRSATHGKERSFPRTRRLDAPGVVVRLYRQVTGNVSLFHLKRDERIRRQCASDLKF